MFIVGEKINGTISKVKEAIHAKDGRFLVDLARLQLEAGASIIDVNVGPGDEEAENLIWAVRSIQSSLNVPLMLDSGNPEVLKAAKEVHSGRPILNSISGEKSEMERLLPLLSKGDCGVVVSCIDDEGIPSTPEGTLKVAEKSVYMLTEAGVNRNDIYFDPLVMSLATEFQAGKMAAKAIRLIHKRFPYVHTIAAISNISFGLPNRKLLNRTFLVAAMVAGLDSFIVDVTDRPLMATLWAANLLSGNDEGCRNYLQAYRNGVLE